MAKADTHHADIVDATSSQEATVVTNPTNKGFGQHILHNPWLIVSGESC